MFPGQGSQYIGMGKEFYEQIPICKEVYDLAAEVRIGYPGTVF